MEKPVHDASTSHSRPISGVNLQYTKAESMLCLVGDQIRYTYKGTLISISYLQNPAVPKSEQELIHVGGFVMIILQADS